MSYNETVLKDLLRIIPQKGKVEWIGIRPKKKEDLSVVESIKVTKKTGLVGDHFKGNFSVKRQVTLIQQEHLIAVSSILGRKRINPKLTRRNIVVSGINLLSLKHNQFRIGSVILETTGICAPCSRMEENLGVGGYNAMRGHGGITATVIEEGEIKLGDTMELI
jgi:MOSC domain-containing protein YiiM